ncbi:MAG TPA: hypothetical protein VHL53_16355 [Acidimicrobiia bacterium]|nr:hypothetical protein [Acidimicrobiia bacterium]
MSPRRRHRRLAWLLALPTVVLGGAAVAAVLHGRVDPPGAPTVLGSQIVKADGNGAGNGNDPKSFVVSGAVEGLAPGVTRSLFVTLSNPNNSDISVQALTVAAGDGSKGCPGSNVRVGTLTAPVFVPGRGSAQVTLPITMLGTAPGACQGADFPLTYGGSAVKA